ncbi:hypothetical protein SAMN05444374_11649 [Rhodococcoides kroppenstedtii]|uniref:Uncharacterized protein n=1 Tax=Rhodococcoides kroppenstedtii TaxID=293050 RepID=A0A1I0UCA5_9NOCA|nr:hypothetical protein [Rhodococcus kroppenstedtii]SFA60876.1 hypothetical protein SAMN05444374_11649 [Rhodococcus kroppenstedtii]
MDLVAEALKPHSWHVKTAADGSLHGVCLGCIENGVLPEFHTWHGFAEHLAAVIADLPDVAIIALPPAHPLTMALEGRVVPPLVAMDVARQVYADGLAAHRAGQNPSLACEQCAGSGTVECWNPGGPCATPNELGCETCGPCNACAVQSVGGQP